MKSKGMLLVVSLLSCASLAAVAVTGSALGEGISIVRGNAGGYSLILSSTRNKVCEEDDSSYDGEATLRSELGGEIRFAYSKVKGSSSAWQTLGSDGCFYNVDPIHGLKSVNLSFGNEGSSYEILYSRDNSFDKSKELSSTKGSASFDFDGYLPNYFKIKNTSGNDLDVASVEIEYSCIDDYLSLTLSSEDEEKGKVNGPSVVRSNEQVSVEANPTDGYIFKGWYSGGELASSENPYVFIMPETSLSLEARFASKEEEEKLGILPVVDSESNTLTYGLYPQSRVTDESTLSLLNELKDKESNGWYLLNGEYYAKKEASPYSSSYVFDDGDTIVKGTAYWFKCETIKWRILSENSGEYSLVSTFLLDAHRYNASWSGKNSKGYYCNNYSQSEIRQWLNNDFYSVAFSLGDALVQTTEVDNSASSTSSSSNSHACENTNDKVYLLSYKDCSNTSYFSGVSDRTAKTTDWARASGAWCSDKASCLYNGFYWTRTPDDSTPRNAYYVSYGGDGGSYTIGEVNESRTSVRPAINIKIA